jgi:hypothetical protein
MSTAIAKSENVKIKQSCPSKKQALFTRTTFITSREMDFFSEKELVTQTGHSVDDWPLVIAKELIDNALDACEESDIPPVIDVTADECGISVRDNGPGLPETTLKAAMDFTVRASNREAYVAPDRGAQGNALKTLLPMPWVLDPEHGRLIVETHGERHVITCGADPISQRAVVNDAKCKNLQSTTGGKSKVYRGTMVRLEWEPHSIARTRAQGGEKPAWPFAHCSVGFQEDDFRRIIEGFALFNPHATIRLDWFGAKRTWQATAGTWAKWKPHRPTSAHWYERSHFERLIGAYITHDRAEGADRLVSDFVAEFDGLTGSQKRSKVLRDADLLRVPLSSLVIGDRFDSDRIVRLLTAMQRHTRPVNPKLLGIIGEEHLKTRLAEMGVQPESFCYDCRLPPKSKKTHPDAGEKKQALSSVPWVLESAFGWLGDKAEDSRRIYAGANWSPAIVNPFRSFGATGEGLEALLTDMRAGAHEPIVFVLHLAHPRVEYTDRGKSALVIGGAA